MLTKALKNKLPGRSWFKSPGSKGFTVQSVSCEPEGQAKKNPGLVFMKGLIDPKRRPELSLAVGTDPPGKNASN
jgi:hypothetical protein